MIIECKVGTPGALETKTYKTAGPAKNFIRGRMMQRERWASRYNKEAERRIVSAREEFDYVDVAKLPVGETRSWQVTDEYTGVVFVWRVKVLAP